jgi:hypothetical protein
MPFRAVESVAAADSVATSALASASAVDCLAFGKKFRRGLCFEAGDTEAVNILCGVFSNSTVMVSMDESKFISYPISCRHAKMPIQGQVWLIGWADWLLLRGFKNV